MIKAGDKIGNIEVVEEISHEGYYANVYKAKDHSANEDVALKVLKITSEEEEKRFKRENIILHTLKIHENVILPLSDILSHDGQSYYLLELANFNLERYLRITPSPSISELLDIFIQICNGLKYAHSKKIAHRDLHKGNILLKQNGSIQQVKLSDFGQGKDFDHCQEIITATYIPRRAIIITPPEVLAQIVNKNSVFEEEALADIFSLGIILHCIFNPLSLTYTAFISEFKNKANELGIYSKGSSVAKRKKFYDLIMSYFELYELKKHFCILIDADEKLNERINLLILSMAEPDCKKRITDINIVIEEVKNIKAGLSNV